MDSEHQARSSSQTPGLSLAKLSIIDRFRLNGRIALVTAGAGPQFGSSISRALAAANATVITASRDLRRNEEFAFELRECGWDAYGMQVDIQDTESIDRLHSEIRRRFGRLDVLVNNALARDGHNDCLAVQEPSDVARASAGDFIGLIRICQCFLQDMINQGRGSIINISSIYGVVSSDPSMYIGTDMAQPATYPFVKAGMINFTRHLAACYGRHGIRANCISPGGYFDNQTKLFVDAYSNRVPIGRMMHEEDIQGAVVYLASDASSYVTGTNLMVDGGWTSI